jgi:HK97 family phage major capsid protein
MKKNPNIRFKDVKRVSKIKTATKILFATIIIALTVGCYGADFSSVNKSDVATGMTVAALPLFMVAGQFKELEGAELSTFKADATPEQLGEYYEALNKHNRSKLESLIKANASKEDIDKLLESLKSNVPSDYAELKKEHIELMAQVKALKENGSFDKDNSLKGQLTKFITENHEKIKAAFHSGSGVVEFKVVGDMSTASATVPDGIPALQGVQVAPPTNVNLRSTITDGLVSVFNTNLASYPYTETKPKDGDYTFLLEGGTKVEIDFTIETRYAAPKKLAAWEKLTEESINDIPNLISIAYDYLRKKHDLKRQNGILFGDGIGANLKGATTYGRVFSAGALANTVVSPNFMDIVNAAITDIFTTHNYTDEMPYMANLVMIHPNDFYTQLVAAKDGFGHPLYPMASLFNRVVIGGATIVPFEDIPSGKIFVADMSKYNTTNFVPYTVKIGVVNDDFIKNQFVILGESRLHGFVKKLDEQAFLYDDIATIKAAITLV